MEFVTAMPTCAVLCKVALRRFFPGGRLKPARAVGRQLPLLGLLELPPLGVEAEGKAIVSDASGAGLETRPGALCGTWGSQVLWHRRGSSPGVCLRAGAGRVLRSPMPVPKPMVTCAGSHRAGTGVASGAAWSCAPVAARTPSAPGNWRDGKSC